MLFRLFGVVAVVALLPAEVWSSEVYFRQIWSNAFPWSNQSVYYTFDGSFTEEERIKVKQGVKVLQENTCINFHEGETKKFHIKLDKSGGCGTYIGSRERENTTSYGMSLQTDGESSCLSVIGITIHEFLHALGMVHTQSRPERDQYVSINMTNVYPGIDQLQYEIINIRDLTPYDYTSYMHYAAYPNGDSRSVNIDVPTITVKDERYKKSIGNLRGSFYDYHTVNQFYKCYDKCSAEFVSAKCQNGGVPHPRNCRKCLCPSGYGGNFCNKPRGTCGRVISIIPGLRRNITLRIGRANKSRLFAPKSCTYWIQAHPKWNVQLTLESVTKENEGNRTRAEKSSCRFSGFQFKISKDPRLGGAIFCDKEDIGTTLISDLNPAPLILYSYEGRQEYTFQIKHVLSKNTK